MTYNQYESIQGVTTGGNIEHTSWFRVNSDRRRLYQNFAYVHLVLYFYEQNGSKIDSSD